MKIYLLRHEERPINETGFTTSLTNDGIQRSKNNIMDKLISLDIDQIYVSPYVRTLQTIQPYLEATNKKCNVEYSLCEGNANGTHGIDVDLNTVEQSLEQFNCSNYKSLTNIKDVMQYETKDMISDRIDLFLGSINKANNILICSHQYIIHHIISRTCDIDTRILDYKMGNISVLYDNEDGIALEVI